jgi:TonB family protein
MHDAVAEILAQRAALNRGAGLAIAASVVLHAALTGLAVWTAMRAAPPAKAGVVQIQFAPSPAARVPASAAVRRAETPRRAAPPAITEPKPRIEEPKPSTPKPPAKTEKNTVPFSPFGRSTKKGSETPATASPKPAPAPATGSLPGTTTADVPVGGTGVTGIEGGDFPYTLYIDGMQRRVGTNWFRPQVAPGTAAVVYFRILRDGTISEAKVETPSGNGAFDRAALSAVRSSSPLNPLPYGYAGTYLGVHLTFR